MSGNEKYLAVEIFYRQVVKQFPDRFLVTGSFANQVWLGENVRPINDLDLLDTDIFVSEELISNIDVVAEQLPNAHGITWNKSSLAHKSIFEESSAPGVRFTIMYTFGETSSTLQVDIAKADPLTQFPVTVCVPSRLTGLLEITTVPSETAAAWKLHGLFEQMDGRWFSKSLIDLYYFISSGTLSTNAFRTAVLMAFQSRLDPISCLDRLMRGEFGKSSRSRREWQSEVEALSHDQLSMADVLQEVRDFIKPVFNWSRAPKFSSNSDLIEHRIRLLYGLDSREARRKIATSNARLKVLPEKAYHRIGHLPGSQTGPADRHVQPRESERLTSSCNPGCEIIVQEKLDGSCVAIYRRGRDILALGREGDLALGSRNQSRRLWADWVQQNDDLFRGILRDGERLCGEWLAMAHGTRYNDVHEPFYAFDLFNSNNVPQAYDSLQERLLGTGIPSPALLHRGAPISVERALEQLRIKGMDTPDLNEGIIWRLEQDDRRKQIAKYVRPGFQPGIYLQEVSQKSTIWNWHPASKTDRYKENLRLSRLIHKNGQVRVIGFDDSPHKRHVDTVIDINGIITNKAVFEGMISGIVDANGINASFVLADMYLNSKFSGQIHAILIDGITFAFNTVDLPALFKMTGIPIIAVMRHKPNLDKIYNVIEKYCDDPDDYKRIYENAGAIFRHDNFFFQCCGLSEAQAHYILGQTTVNGNVPEPLRIAHLIGSSIKTGQSSNRA